MLSNYRIDRPVVFTQPRTLKLHTHSANVDLNDDLLQVDHQGRIFTLRALRQSIARAGPWALWLYFTFRNNPVIL